ncbi:MAG TPA: hypothetical protein VGD43_19805 [Micromonospora sp.]
MGNGDGWPEEAGPPEGLPDLPPEWGNVVVPDDASDLAAEAAALRRELRRAARQADWRRRLGLPAHPTPRSPSLRLPLLLVSIAVIATLASLLAVMWPGQQRPSTTARPTTNSAPGRPPEEITGVMLPALDVLGENGGPVPLRGLLPAVIVLVDACVCVEQVEAAAGAAPPGVTVVALTGSHPPTPGTPYRAPGSTRVRSLTDPTGELRSFLRTPPRPGVAGALLVARSGRVVRSVPAVSSVADYQADLPKLITG